MIFPPGGEGTPTPLAAYLINGDGPSVNRMLTAAKNPRVRNSIKRNVEQSAAMQLLAQRAAPVDCPDDVVFRWMIPNRRRDPDNIAGTGSKIYLDALQVAGVIPNDGWSEIASITHTFQIKRDLKIDRCRIELYPAGSRVGDD